MKIEDLLEKRERAIYLLTEYLRDSQSSLSLKILSQKLALSRTTLARYIESFDEQARQAKLGLFFQIREEEVSFEKKESLLHADWLAYLCQFSTKYQILLYLFDKEEFAIQALAQHLLISEASLNRQLAALNHLLQDFQISIRNGRLKGSDLQIRYFYYQLFLQTRTLSSIRTYPHFRQIGNYLPLFERFFDTKFNSYQNFQLSLWLGISQRRMRGADVDFSELIQLMKPYIKQKWYQELRAFALTLYQYQPTTVREGEVMSLFAFLVSQSILSPQKIERILAFGGPIREATTWCYQTIREEVGHPLPIYEQILYYLNQLLGKVYFFKGSLEAPIIHEKQYQLISARMLLSTVLENIYQPQHSNLVFQYEEEVANLAGLFDYLSQVQPVVVRIGFISCQSPVIAEPILFQLQKEFERTYAVLIEPFLTSNEYDLLVTDEPVPVEVPCYFFHRRLYASDLLALKKMLANLQKQKEKQAHRRLETSSMFSIERR
ncbi:MULTISPECIES: helix-turn-helix domain-containing protein [unclassified Streptococcus]|uniref:helix-turn-helix domain-containing protein n=1 Tax=unclassified Streptococcus TaxID=2608887 RepID=UPI001072133E|nr:MULTISPECIES: helix-turn-helix domain-containing protein [unclassified Streptococcus]MBF0786402.1 helix-turn-helix domain-containing protein [Streptococcus sp. 19428wC2_LYSM12]MCQ9212509.1 helix-turn-helix domain-containing protein [Streptococcus sp. B01]MCQ9213848.1 helix-turn-helix domain-containing protein [Streptococcus sp. O1]TFV06810.1 DNA-binding protein [Streptococcus sp. LYSM12]